MAEGGLIKGLAGEAEESLQPADAPVAGGEGIAIAAALDAARADPELSADLRRFLDIQAGVGEAQRKLVSIQTEHLHEQREVLISHMRLRRLAERLRIGSQVFFIVAATVVGLILLVLLRDAFTSREVVVEAFEAPPALAARGLSGKVVAEGLLDKLTDLQAATRGTAQKRDISNAWTNDIKVEAPGTGVSIGEIVRLLKAQFGHDVHIEGDLVQNRRRRPGADRSRRRRPAQDLHRNRPRRPGRPGGGISLRPVRAGDSMPNTFSRACATPTPSPSSRPRLPGQAIGAAVRYSMSGPTPWRIPAARPQALDPLCERADRHQAGLLGRLQQCDERPLDVGRRGRRVANGQDDGRKPPAGGRARRRNSTTRTSTT